MTAGEDGRGWGMMGGEEWEGTLGLSAAGITPHCSVHILLDAKFQMLI